MRVRAAGARGTDIPPRFFCRVSFYITTKTPNPSKANTSLQQTTTNTYFFLNITHENAKLQTWPPEETSAVTPKSAFQARRMNRRRSYSRNRGARIHRRPFLGKTTFKIKIPQSSPFPFLLIFEMKKGNSISHVSLYYSREILRERQKLLVFSYCFLQSLKNH